MCGIFGALGVKHTLLHDYASEVHQSLNHRGPDDKGLEIGNHFTLGFNRLSILDLSANGHQPMYDRTGRYVIVFNGEIYNYKEIRDEKLYDINFQSKTDTEVLLNLLILYREKVLNMLNGMFAFCFVDTQTGEVIIGRDRFGIKPLYFSVQDRTLFFTSELKGLRFIKELNWELNELALLEYLGIGYISQDKSIFSHWFKLLPAHYLNFNVNELNKIPTPVRYWKLSFENPYDKSYEEAIVEFEDLFKDAVAIRLRSDVPIGIFLSGGIDSGLVAAFAQKIQPINCYTIAYKEKKFDESKLAALTAQHIGAAQEVINLERIHEEELNSLGHYYDEPFSDSSALPSYQVCKAGSEKATVFLTGDAGDEAFAGYNRYIKRLSHDSILKRLKFLRFFKLLATIVPFKYAIKFHKLTAKSVLRDSHYDEIPGNPWQMSILNKNYHTRFKNYFKGFTYSQNNVTLNQQMFDYEHYLPNDILVKMDRASMANSIEVRSPFLDYRLHEFAARLPKDWIIDASRGKKILRDVAKKYLPEEVFHAKKRGFGIPLAKWTRSNGFLNRLQNKFSSSPIFKQYLNKKGVNKLIALHKKGKINGGALLWRLSMLLDWEERNLNKDS